MEKKQKEDLIHVIHHRSKSELAAAKHKTYTLVELINLKDWQTENKKKSKKNKLLLNENLQASSFIFDLIKIK